MSTGTFTTCALTSGSNISCWGWSAYGALGTGTPDTYNQLTPAAVSLVAGWSICCSRACMFRLYERMWLLHIIEVSFTTHRLGRVWKHVLKEIWWRIGIIQYAWLGLHWSWTISLRMPLLRWWICQSDFGYLEYISFISLSKTPRKFQLRELTIFPPHKFHFYPSQPHFHSSLLLKLMLNPHLNHET